MPMKVLCASLRADQFVELGLERGAVAVLGVLDQEHHEEGDDGRPGVDDQLPGIGEAEKRPARGPDDDDCAAEDERDRPPGRMCDGRGEVSEELCRSGDDCHEVLARDQFRAGRI